MSIELKPNSCLFLTGPLDGEIKELHMPIQHRVITQEITYEVNLFYMDPFIYYLGLPEGMKPFEAMELLIKGYVNKKGDSNAKPRIY